MGDISSIGAMMARILVADNRVVIPAGLRALLQSRSDFDACGEACDAAAVSADEGNQTRISI